MALRLTSSTHRQVPRSVAGVLAELELLAPIVVDVDIIHSALQASGDPRADEDGRPAAVIDQLRRTGWLLPLRTRGLWEFAPGSRSGAFRSGDPFTELRAYLTRYPDRIAAVAMESAAFRRGLAGHPPAREVLAVDEWARSDTGLGDYRLVRLDLGKGAATDADGIPMHTVEALLVSMAAKPTGYKDWPNVRQWLTRAAAQAHVMEADEPTTNETAFPGPTGAPMRKLLEDMPAATWARAAYLLHAGLQPERAESLLAAGPGRPSGPVYLGPRSPRGHGDRVYDAMANVYDAVVMAGDSLQERPGSGSPMPAASAARPQRW